MGRIVISDNVSIDGVDNDPTGEEGFRHGGWFAQVGDKDREAFYKIALDEALGAEAFLLGRKRYEFPAARWPSRSGELADRLNSLPKYVVSSTLVDPDWNNSTVITGDMVTEVSTLKERMDGDIIVPGSHQLVHTLMEHDLVDELRLLVYPVVLGDGERLFGETSDKLPMRLLEARTVGERLAYLTYEVSGRPRERSSLSVLPRGSSIPALALGRVRGRVRGTSGRGRRAHRRDRCVRL